MDKMIKRVYECYLGRDLGYRTGAILQFVKDEDGRDFFEKYSEPTDSVMSFIKKVDNKGLW